MKLLITVDTEADNQWAQDGSVALKNLDALLDFQTFVTSHGFLATYLASYETLTHPALTELAKLHREGKAEVGGHLHPWTTPPYDEKDKTVQRFPSELPDDVLDAKLSALTESLTTLLGEVPYSFRAGKWGFDARVARALVRHGYRADSSITPGVAWKDIIKNPETHTSIPDFSSASPMPSRIEGLLEIPMTVLRTGFLRRQRWCRIFPKTTLAELIAVHKAATRQKLPALVFMTHSSELLAGASPYAKDVAAVERTRKLFGEFLAYLKGQGVEPAFMREFAESFRA